MTAASSWLLVVLALVSQLALGGIFVPDDAPAAQLDRLDAVSVMCGGHAGGPAVPVQRHRAVDVAVCPLSVALALPAVVPVGGVVFAMPTSVAMPRPAERPDIRGPPVIALRPGSQRGPPVLA